MTDTPRMSANENGQYRLLVDAISTHAVCMLDGAGRVISWNQGAERFTGYSSAEIIGRPFSLIYPTEDVDAGVPSQGLQTAADEGHFDHEGWHARKDGSRFWGHVAIDPILTNGTIVGYAVVITDLTERRRAEEQFRLSEQRFRFLVQGVTDYAIYMLDPDGYVTNWNSGAENIKGYKPQEIIGKHFSTFYTEEDRAKGMPQESLDAARQHGRFEREGIRVRKDGTTFWANVVIDAVHDDNGQLVGFAKVTRDITERRKAAEALARANEDLMQAQKMEAIGRLTGGVAHDFNNLMMAVSGSLELLRKRLFDERSLRLVDNAMQGIQRGATLTQRMLAFARRQELRPDTVSVRGLVGGLTDLMARTLGPAIQIETSIPEDIPPILVDENQLELALLNLAVNAKDAMPDGGHLTISAAEADGRHIAALQGGRYVRLSITDTGTGMDAETLAHAMEPFFTTKGVGQGTGLGLAMVRGLSEQSGGTVTIESELGKGTTVAIWIPVSADAAASKESAVEEVEVSAEPANARRLRVLVVDDDVLVAMNTTAMLEDLGHEAVEVHSGRQALDVLETSNGFDLVITDQAMPQMTGTQLASEAKAKWPQLPVILATGYAELPEDADRSMTRLSKPFMQTDLERALSQVTSGHIR